MSDVDIGRLLNKHDIEERKLLQSRRLKNVFFFTEPAAFLWNHPSCSSPRSKGNPPSNFDSAQLAGFCRPSHFEKSGLPDLYFNAAVRQTCPCKVTGADLNFKVTGSGRPDFQNDQVCDEPARRARVGQ